MDLLLQPVIDVYRTILKPVAPFSWFGIPTNTLDLAATVRLCVIMRQLREMARVDHNRKRVAARRAIKGKDKALEAGFDEDEDAVPAPQYPGAIQERSFVRDAAATLLVVYGGEMISAPFLGLSPSFMYSALVPALCTLTQAAVEYLPSVPQMQFELEGPLSFFDAINRAYLLCTLVPPTVVNHTNPTLAASPWTLLLTSFLTANGGFMLVNTFSFLAPTALTFTTPTELLPYGWTTMDLWAAPLITGLYALLTHAQPFWATTHAVLAGAMGAAPAHADVKDPAGHAQSPGVVPLDPETARAACALVLMAMFTTRVTRNFGGVRVMKSWLSQDPAAAAKKAQ